MKYNPDQDKDKRIFKLKLGIDLASFASHYDRWKETQDYKRKEVGKFIHEWIENRYER
jgi:hypothetical protein